MLDLSFIAHYILLVPHARPLQRVDLVLRVLRGLSSDPREVKTHLEQILHYQRVYPRGSCMVDELKWKPILKANQCKSIERVRRLRPWLQDGWPSFQLALYLITCYSHFLALLAH